MRHQQNQYDMGLYSINSALLTSNARPVPSLKHPRSATHLHHESRFQSATGPVCESQQAPVCVRMEQRWFLLTVTPLGDRQISGALLMHRDVTARRRIEENLRASEARFRQMAQNIRDVFFVVDAASHHILYTSPAYEQIWGRSGEDLYADPQEWAWGVHPDDRALVQEKYQAGLLTGTFEFRIVRLDSSIRSINMRGFPMMNEAGVLIRIAGVIENVTQRRHAAQALLDGRQRLEGLVITAMDWSWRSPRVLSWRT
jgi:PAS domain S-box-containing protein